MIPAPDDHIIYPMAAFERLLDAPNMAPVAHHAGGLAAAYRFVTR